MTLCYLDFEATGTDAASARIIQIGATIPGREPFASHVNPGCPIPAKVTELTLIDDARVKDSPAFREIGRSLVNYLAGCDLVVFGGLQFDIPLLAEECCRADIEWDWKAHRIFDLGILAKKLNPNTLAATYERMTGKPLEQAHDALADARATEAVFWAFLRRNLDLGRLLETDRDAFAKECRYDDDRERCDPHGKIVLIDGHPCFNTFRNKGVRVRDDLGYARWILDRSDFPATTKLALDRIVDEILNDAMPDDDRPEDREPAPHGFDDAPLF